MQGLIGFSTSKSWIAKVIKFFRKSQFSHCFVVIGSINGRALVAEAGSFEVRIAPLDRFLNAGSKIELWMAYVPEEKIKDGINEIVTLVGKTYGWFQLVGFIWIWICDKLGCKGKSNPFRNGIICSEYVYYFLREVDYKYINQFTPDETAPDHIYNALQIDKKSKLVATSDYGSSDLIWEI